MFKKTLAIIISVLTVLFCLCPAVYADTAPVNASVKEYLAAPSQYTNNTSFIKGISETLSGKSSLSSLGNFGGYVIYEFNEDILNSPDHKYGIDFMIYGNSFNGNLTTQEPGQVWVSKDRVKWYALAGSEHYENSTIWDYSVKYINTGTSKSNYTDSMGDSGCVSTNTVSPYPLQERYPDIEIDSEVLKLSGILLAKQRLSSTANGIFTSFGYVDTLKCNITGLPENPYVEEPIQKLIGGQFDISWAVDESGKPVYLDSVKYVKVQTATFIDAGAFGEKSTEISCVALAPEEDFESSYIKPEVYVNGKKVVFNKNNFCRINDTSTGIDISVDAPDSNVYINNERTSKRLFYAPPEKGLVRIIVQSGFDAAQIYYLDVSSAGSEEELVLSHSQLDIPVFGTDKITANMPVSWRSSDDKVAAVDKDGNITAAKQGTAIITAVTALGQIAECRVNVTVDTSEENGMAVTFCASDGDIIIPCDTLMVFPGTAKAYGYDVAAYDHNSKAVEGATFFDALVAAHIKLYGNKFTGNTARDYLIMQNGFITKAFGKSAASSGFTVNGTFPNDGIINKDYGTFTGYACDTAVISEGDKLSYFLYRDTKYFSDIYAYFDKDNYPAFAGEKFSIKLKGYGVMVNGLNPFDVIDSKYSKPVAKADIFVLTEDGSVKVGTTNKRGAANIKLNDEGTYTLFAVKDTNDDEAPMIIPFAKVTVTKSSDNAFVRFFKRIAAGIAKIFNMIFRAKSAGKEAV
ncbi:MAG: Ig-like domain-containing protein [Saccharofermentans sp.]|nr:Ig-like domain-containing protein [Saccharofermentans sp.]